MSSRKDGKETQATLQESSHKRLSMFISVSRNIPVISRREIAYFDSKEMGKKHVNAQKNSQMLKYQ